jgi:hypothetical protein
MERDEQALSRDFRLCKGMDRQVRKVETVV